MSLYRGSTVCICLPINVKHFVVLYLAVISVPDPIALYPLNSKYETREINNRQPHGVPVGVSLAAGPNGKPNDSYQFAGQPDSYIEFPNNGSLDVQHSITMLCWVYLENSSYESGPLFDYKNPKVYWGVRLGISSGKLAARYTDRSDLNTNYELKLDTVQSLALNRWHYVGSSYDYHTGNATLWLNGTAVQELHFKANMSLATQDLVRMGAITDLVSFKGRITAMQVYDVALTAKQINEVKNDGRGRD